MKSTEDVIRVMEAYADMCGGYVSYISKTGMTQKMYSRMYI